jgi:hemolysin activation/secretion protein
MQASSKLFLLCVGLVFSCASIAETPQTSVAKKNAFTVNEYQVSGNTLLPAIRVEAAVYRHLGEDKTIGDVEQARSALEKEYHDAGYLTVLVDIPEQTVGSGMVQLKVTEGSVEKARVVGSRYFSLNKILAKVPELAVGNVPYFPELQKQLVAVNSVADLKVTPVMRPGNTPGKLEAELKVEDQLPFHSSIELNNHASPNTSEFRLAGMVRYDNLWQRAHSLSLQFQTAPQNVSEVKVLSGTYLMPLANSDKQLAIYGVISRSNVATIGEMSVLGKGNILGVRLAMPLSSREKLFHSATLGADYKHFLDAEQLAGANTGKTPMSYLPFSLGYSVNMPDETGMSVANATLNFHLRGIGDRKIDCSGQVISEFECKRYHAKPDYFYLRGGVERTRNLPKGMVLFAKLDGQLASGPLISNEQFTAGGADSVRGYLESEQAGDDGSHATLELRGPQWARGKFSDLRTVVFVEAAHLRVREALPEQTDSFNLASAGLGLRTQLGKSFTLGVDVAVPLKSTTFTQADKVRVGFKVVGTF